MLGAVPNLERLDKVRGISHGGLWCRHKTYMRDWLRKRTRVHISSLLRTRRRISLLENDGVISGVMVDEDIASFIAAGGDCVSGYVGTARLEKFIIDDPPETSMTQTIDGATIGKVLDLLQAPPGPVESRFDYVAAEYSAKVNLPRGAWWKSPTSPRDTDVRASSILQVTASRSRP
tara:strand:+ start:2430 stop:2957 length:528 start_codon:yes stop_codon:yes gene_type:complete